MKAFFTWLVAQALFARFLIGLIIEAWVTLKLPSDQLGWVLLITALFCAVELAVSGAMLFPLIIPGDRQKAECGHCGHKAYSVVVR